MKVDKSIVRNYNIWGYFKHGGVKWLIVDIYEDTLVGIDISPKGAIHTLNIHEDEVYELVLLLNK